MAGIIPSFLSSPCPDLTLPEERVAQENSKQQMDFGKKGFAHLLCLRGNKIRLWKGVGVVFS